LKRIVDTVLPDEAAAGCQVVFISDGVDWIRNHLVPVMPEGTLVILDAYHVLEHLGEYAAGRFGKGTAAAKQWMSRRAKILLGKRRYRKARGILRKGHTKRRRRRPKVTAHLSQDPHGAGEELSWLLIEEEPLSDEFTALVNYLAGNSDRTDYPAYRARGIHIGSGAMESFHRVASQMRLKAAGTRWTPERAIAVLNTRLLWLAGRWDAFWGHPDLTSNLRRAFQSPPELAA
jgi:hypothetical protein